MQTIKTFAILLDLPLIFASCEKNNLSPEAGELEGIWIEKGYEENITIFEKAKKIDENKYGFEISEGGKFLEHKNSGWCGTHPISYANYDGTWKYESDSVLVIDVGYWGGTITYNLEIVELTSNTLKTRYQYLD